MKPTKTLFVLALLVVPSLASAQGYYGGSGPGYEPSCGDDQADARELDAVEHASADPQPGERAEQ